MSSLMMKASMVSLASLWFAGKPNSVKKRVDAARSFTGRLTAILVDIGASVVVAGGSYLLKNAVSGEAGDLAFALASIPDDRAQHRRHRRNGRRAVCRATLMGVDQS